MKNKRLGWNQKQKRSPRELERRKKATELSERSGIPIYQAFHVVDGRVSLDDVLKKMMLREKVRRLMNQHDLPASIAGQVARGHVPLDKVLVRMARRNSDFWRARYSIFDDIAAPSAHVDIQLFGQPWCKVQIKAVTKYDVIFQKEGEEEQTVPKHHFKMVAKTAEDAELAQSLMQSDPEVGQKSLSGTEDLTERLQVNKEDFFDALQKGKNIRFLFRDGQILESQASWFSRYEFAVQVGQDANIVGFFHALLDWSVVEPVVEKNKAKSTSQKKKSKAKSGKGRKKKRGRR